MSGRRPFAPIEPLAKDNGIVSLDYGNKFKSQRKFGLMTLRGYVKLFSRLHANIFASEIRKRQYAILIFFLYLMKR